MHYTDCHTELKVDIEWALVSLSANVFPKEERIQEIVLQDLVLVVYSLKMNVA